VAGVPERLVVSAQPGGHRRWAGKLRRSSAAPGEAINLVAAPEVEGQSGASVTGSQVDPARETALLAAAAAGEATAVQWLLDEVAPVVYGFLFARVGGHETVAEDLLQETLLEAVRSASGFRGEASASTWMCAIARRRLARYYESERRAEMARRSLRLIEDRSVPTGSPVDLVERQDEVVRALGRLPALQREVLVLKYLEGLSVVDIADQVNRSRVQVQSLLQRGRDGLRRELGGQGA
jgi:RNA polymerase sigma-70 factor, ECF subfamily